MEIEELAKALGEKLAALEDEIRAQCEQAGHSGTVKEGRHEREEAA